MDENEQQIRGAPPLTDYELLILSAFRYALGRRTYLPHAIVPELKKQVELGHMSERARQQMIKEISNAEVCDELGHQCDKKLWLEFKEWLMDFNQELDIENLVFLQVDADKLKDFYPEHSEEIERLSCTMACGCALCVLRELNKKYPDLKPIEADIIYGC